MVQISSSLRLLVFVASSWPICASAIPFPLQAIAPSRRAPHGFGAHVRRVSNVSLHHNATRQRMKHTLPKTSPGHEYNRTISRVTKHQRSVPTGSLGGLDLLNNHGDSIIQYTHSLSALAAVASTDGQSPTFGQNSSDYLSDLSTQLTGFNSLLRQLGANDGLTYFDKSDQLEVLLKNIVNALKDALESSSILVYRVPLLNETLGPLVYDLKCAVDLLADTVENITDATLNVLAPLLRSLDLQYIDFLCGPLLGGLHLSSTINLCV